MSLGERHLRAFVTVLEQGSLAKGAVILGLSDSTLSRTLARLEREVGVTLLQRTPRGVGPTEAGVRYEVEAREILDHFRRAGELARGAGEASAKLVVGHISPATACLTRALRRLHRLQPSLSVELHEGDTEFCLKALADETFDVVLVRPSDRNSHLAQELIQTETFVLALPASHARADRTVVAVEDLDLPLIRGQRHPSPETHDLIDAYLAGIEQFPSSQAVTSNLATDILSLVGAEFGAAIVCESSAAMCADPTVTFHRLAPEPPTVQTVVAWRRSDRRPTVAAFRRILVEPLEQISIPSRHARTGLPAVL